MTATSYRYEWTWQWEAERISLTDIPESDLLKEIESQIKSKLTTKPEVTGIESITHTDVKHWTEWAMKRRYSGTTKTVFLSTLKSGSPIAPAIVALIYLVVKAVIVALVVFAIYTVSSNVSEVVTKAPEVAALGVGAVILGILFLMGFRRKEKK